MGPIISGIANISINGKELSGVTNCDFKEPKIFLLKRLKNWFKLNRFFGLSKRISIKIKLTKEQSKQIKKQFNTLSFINFFKAGKE